LTNKKSRWLRLLIYASLMTFLIYYGQKNHPGVTYAECTSDPIKYHNTPIEIGTEATINEIYPDYFLISQMQHLIKILGPAPDHAQVGEFVTLSGTFQKDGSIIPASIRIAEKRRLKIWISLFPMIVVIFYFFKIFKWDWARWRFVRKYA